MAASGSGTVEMVSFEEVVQKILDTPQLMEDAGGSSGGLAGRMRIDDAPPPERYCGYC